MIVPVPRCHILGIHRKEKSRILKLSAVQKYLSYQDFRKKKRQHPSFGNFLAPEISSLSNFFTNIFRLNGSFSGQGRTDLSIKCLKRMNFLEFLVFHMQRKMATVNLRVENRRFIGGCLLFPRD